MHISGKIMIPIGIVFIILAGFMLVSIDEEAHLQQLDQDGVLIIELHDDDQAGELGFSFWIEGNYIDDDGNGLWDACEAFNASVTGAEGIKDADTERFQPICDEKDEEWDDLGLIKVGQACNSVVKEDENSTLEVDIPMRCPDGPYEITANSEAQVIYEDEMVGEVFEGIILGICGCCCGLITLLLGIGFGFGMMPSRSQAATMQLGGSSPAPIPTDSESVPGTVQGAIFGAGPAPQASDPPAETSEGESVQASADALKKQFLAGAEDRVSDHVGEPEKE